MLIVLAPSPPVPAVSTRSSRSGRTTRTCFRIASAQPAISSGVSPFSRSATRKPPICAEVASPRMISSITPWACARLSDRPSSRSASAAWITGGNSAGGRARAASARSRGGTGRPRSEARGGGRPSPLRRGCGPRSRARPARVWPQASGSGRRSGPVEAPRRRPCRRARPLEALPCRSARAWPTSPPNASTIAWCPRQTPSVGTRGPSRRISSTRDAGVDGPAGAGGDDELRGGQLLGLVDRERVVPEHPYLRAKLARTGARGCR